ncbi:unnamed protein product [Enterobius vermicularis]|uniref:Uncharacterized protein n=1 Tax=Enterobius vermicularis TaxID=51028 RepID=A0A0N4VIM8_ENTVE|nr:unnamed protein product [Enterobius vermicularis]
MCARVKSTCCWKGIGMERNGMEWNESGEGNSKRKRREGKGREGIRIEWKAKPSPLNCQLGCSVVVG